MKRNMNGEESTPDEVEVRSNELLRGERVTEDTELGDRVRWLRCKR